MSNINHNHAQLVNKLLDRMNATRDAFKVNYKNNSHVDYGDLLRIMDNIISIVDVSNDINKHNAERNKDMDVVASLLKKHKITIADLQHVMQNIK